MIHRRALVVISLALLVLLFPFPIVLIQITNDQLFNYRAQLLLADLPLAAVFVMTLPDLRTLRARAGSALPWAILAVAVGASLIAHPTLLGVTVVARVAATLGIIVALRGLASDERRLVVAALAVATAVQLVWGVAQIVRGTPLGLGALGEFADPLFVRGGLVTPRGSLGHGYMLAAMALLSSCGLLVTIGGRARPVLIAFAGALAAPVGLTFSRAALGAAVLIGASLGLSRHRIHRLALAAFAVAIVVAAIWRIDGWLDRADQTLGPPREDSALSRETLFGEALLTIASAPIVGVGPGQALVLPRRVLGTDAQPVPDVPLLVATESGVVAGLAAAAVVVVLIVRAARGSTEARIVALTLLPFFLFDQFLYSEPQGLVLVGVWLGLSDAFATSGESSA
jgi:hypothetical protein